MQAKDGDNGYGWVSIVLHWGIAIFIIYQLFSGSSIEDAPTEAAELPLILSHISTGALAFLFIFARIAWRFNQGEQDLPPAPKAISLLARWVPRLLLVGIATLIITGPLHVWSKGFDIQVFDLFTVPSPIAETHWLHELTEEMHEFAAKSVFILIILHILGGLKHLIVDKDGVMQRMLTPRK